MRDTLMECHERELFGQEPCNPHDTRYIKGLFVRGFIELRTYASEKGKIKTGFYITEAGKREINRD